MKRALILSLPLTLAACDESRLQRRPEPAASASAPVVTASASASAPAAPRELRPPGPGASREAREKAALEILEGRAGVADLPLADVDRGERFEPWLRSGMSAPMKIDIDPPVTTDLDRDAVKKAVERHLMRLRICYAEGLRQNPNLQGRVIVKATIPAAGRPSAVENGGADVPDSRVVSCVLEAFKKMDFPAPQGASGSAVITARFFPG